MGPVLLPENQAEQFQADYCCAGCWGRLNVYYHTDETFRVVCDKCGDGRGFVNKAWVETRRNEDFAQATEVKRMLRRIGVIESNPHTEEELIKSLGF